MINIYTGLMGAGKTNAAIEYEVLGTLRDEPHRRVVAVIEGLDLEEFARQLKLPLEDVQKRLIPCSYEDVLKLDFVYDPENGKTNTTIQPGDKVVLDEVLRYFSRRSPIPDAWRNFFRMHRHYASPETGQTCDITLISQTLRGLDAELRDLIELQMACKKPKSLGIATKSRVQVLEKGEEVRFFFRSLNSPINKLYKSHSSKNAKESLDKKQNIFKKPFFMVVLPTIILASLFWAIPRIYSLLSDPGQISRKKSATATATAASAPASATVSTATPTLAVTTVPAPAAVRSTSIPGQDISEWNIVARYWVGSLPVFVLQDAQGRRRTLTGASFSQGAGNDLFLTVPKAPGVEFATTWSASIPQQPKGPIK